MTSPFKVVAASIAACMVLCPEIITAGSPRFTKTGGIPEQEPDSGWKPTVDPSESVPLTK